MSETSLNTIQQMHQERNAEALDATEKLIAQRGGDASIHQIDARSPIDNATTQNEINDSTRAAEEVALEYAETVVDIAALKARAKMLEATRAAYMLAA